MTRLEYYRDEIEKYADKNTLCRKFTKPKILKVDVCGRYGHNCDICLLKTIDWLLEEYDGEEKGDV